MLEIKDLHVEAGGKEILKGVSLSVKEGETCVLFGPNGSGKSTMLAAIMGYGTCKVTKGQIIFKGQDITNMSVDERAKLGIGMMMQRPPNVTGVKLGEKLEAAGAASEAYAAKMNAAGAATDNYTAATATLAQSYAQVSSDMKLVVDGTKAYKEGIDQVGKSIAALNTVYELQLQSVNAQTEAQKAAAAAAKEAAEAQTAFAAGAKKLQSQVAGLNDIYGNM